MEIIIKVNGRRIAEQIEPDLLLIDFLRKHGCYSVKRGCETANCGLCTVLMDNTPVLSCSVLAARADGHEIYTLEGLQEEAAEFVGFIADQGADQCGFCNPGFVMNIPLAKYEIYLTFSKSIGIQELKSFITKL